ncbi:threonine--tRNA ligase [Euryarchaeota archaeon]|nr:threonine--tRNA ligase [Euryarchaeota archaeon]MDA9829352.1 threonine--tRNA ligase [Candidatus Poseidoniaceae archaeon]MDA8594149.1 threonine--tRNA ligase [Euryarchaeota archaeon]MDA8689845.1 threonine--tRNA ligase [Euryarchaeota archaeon]MDA8701551.1 threonine--tRNA ligase [Euryarchaeota archaeon]
MTLINITLPDGTVNEYAAGITCAEVITDALGRKHGCLAARIDGEDCDLSRMLDTDCAVEGILTDSDEGIHILRHSASHLLAQAVMALYPDAKPTIGPAIDRGFYYDFAMEPIAESDLKPIQKKMQEIARKNFTVERVELSDEELQQHFAHNPYKLEIINDKIEDGGGSTIYKQDEWYDLCLGPHVPNTSRLMHVKLTSISSAYWRGDQDREQLVRIYGIVEPSKEALRATLTRLEEAKKRDHRKLGKDLQLFHIDEEVGQGLILWTPRGAVIRQELQDFISYHLRRQGYSQVFTPHVGKLDLYRTSGHFPYYQDSQYPPMVERDLMNKLADEGCTCGELSNLMKSGDIDGYMLKPMNCPHHVKIYASQMRSYRDLPLRLAEFGTVYRWEQSGEISGMTRVRGFTQDDAHLFVTEEQIAEEVLGCIELVQIIFDKLGMTDYRVRVGLRDLDSDKYVGDPARWDKAEDACRAAAESLGVQWSEEQGEAAFYGPKIDFVVKDVIGREWQLGTVQVDYNLPERFGLEYKGSDGELHRPVMIHRAPFGSMERFCGVLIEHFAGKFPTWLTPTQCHIITISEKHTAYADEVAQLLRDNGIRVEIDNGDDTIGKKIRTHRKMQPAYMVILGDGEIESRSVSLRARNGDQVSGIPLERFLTDLKHEIEEKVSQPALAVNSED